MVDIAQCSATSVKDLDFVWKFGGKGREGKDFENKEERSRKN